MAHALYQVEELQQLGLNAAFDATTENRDGSVYQKACAGALEFCERLLPLHRKK